jgi:hypothetical protein
MDALKNIRDWNDRMLAGVGAKFGKSSVAYEQAGGARKGAPRKRKAAKKSS